MPTAIEREVLDLLAKLPVPPGYNLPEGASTGTIRAFEQRIGFRLPSELRIWLKYHNGAFVGPGGVFGIDTDPDYLDIEMTMEAFEELDGHEGWIQKRFIPIAGDGCGNYYVLVPPKQKGKPWPVVFIDSISDRFTPTYVVASDLWHFFRFLFLSELKKSKWPFAKKEVCAADPEILNVQFGRLPWEPKI